MLDFCCSDDIVLSIALYLPSHDLLSLALSCKRFGLGTNEMMSFEDMTRKIQQPQMKYIVKMEDDGGAISICHNVHDDDRSINDINDDWPEFAVRNWSLMEEAALRRALTFLSRDGGSLVWRNGKSWMEIYYGFEFELSVLRGEEVEYGEEEAEAAGVVDLVSSYVDMFFSFFDELMNLIKYALSSMKPYLRYWSFHGILQILLWKASRMTLVMSIAFLESYRRLKGVR